MNEADFIAANPADEQKPEGEVVTPEIDNNDPEPLQLSEVEQKAYDQGWRPQEEFDGPEDNWKTAKEYVKDGEWLGKIRELNQKSDNQKREFDERIDNLNKLNEARRISEIEGLKQKQRDAVAVADTAGYEEAQGQIDNLEKQEVVAKPVDNRDPAIVAWESDNPWINEVGNEKAEVAKSLYIAYEAQNPNATISQALEHVDKRVGQLYPAETKENPRRQQPNSTENTTKPTQRKGKDLTMSDLTPAEQGDWNMFGSSMFGDQKTFLKAVADARKK